jgi:hypothetical protein
MLIKRSVGKLLFWPYSVKKTEKRSRLHVSVATDFLVVWIFGRSAGLHRIQRKTRLIEDCRCCRFLYVTRTAIVKLNHTKSFLQVFMLRNICKLLLFCCLASHSCLRVNILWIQICVLTYCNLKSHTHRPAVFSDHVHKNFTYSNPMVMQSAWEFLCMKYSWLQAS